MDSRNEIKRLITERKRLEKILLKASPMGAAQLCKRPSGTAYLSCYINGIKRNRYVKKTDEKKWKQLTDEWKTFSKSLILWNELNIKLEKALRNEGKIRQVLLPESKSRKVQ